MEPGPSVRCPRRWSGWGATTSADASPTSRACRRSSTRRSTPASRSSTRPTSTAGPGARSCSGGRSARDATTSLVATKFGMPVDEERKGAKPDYVRRAAEDSLRRLGTDRIDLYQLHEPDPDTPIADTLGALDELVRAGKVREIGCSNFSAEQLREAEAAAAPEARARFVSVQNEYNLFVPRARGRGPRRMRPAGARVHPLLPARERRPHRQVPRRRGAAGGHPAVVVRRRRGAGAADRRAPGRRRPPARVGGRPWALHVRAGHRLAARAATGRLGDRRRVLAGPGAGKRGRRRLGRSTTRTSRRSRRHSAGS